MKNILITGASSGIGETVARYLSEQGYRVILVARSRDKLEQMCSELQNAICFPYDLSDLNNIESIFQFCKENEFLLDGLVYGAGYGKHMPIRSLQIDSFQTAIAINCMAFIQMGKHIASRKYTANGASVVAISSFCTQTLLPGTASYSISKTALNVACTILSKEVVKRGIRVNAVMPAYMYGSIGEDLLSTQPLGAIQLENVAHLIEYLLSDKSKSITGALIPISGGLN